MSDRNIPSNERSFQLRVWDWCMACFVRPDALSREQRAFRFAEEAIELTQAIGINREDVLRLVEYVYGRPPGSDVQEVGGVMVTLAALSQACCLDMLAWGEEELRRCIANTEKIRAKDLAKPKRSPLPGFAPETPAPQAPIAKLTMAAWGPAGVEMYTPGLPPGDHDLYCEPMSVAPSPGLSAHVIQVSWCQCCHMRVPDDHICACESDPKTSSNQGE